MPGNKPGKMNGREALLSEVKYFTWLVPNSIIVRSVKPIIFGRRK